MGSDGPDLNALAVNVVVPDELQWTDTRDGQEFMLTTITVRLLPDGYLASKAYGRPTAGGRGGYTSFRVPDDRALIRLINAAALRAGSLWTSNRGAPVTVRKESE